MLEIISIIHGDLKTAEMYMEENITHNILLYFLPAFSLDIMGVRTRRQAGACVGPGLPLTSWGAREALTPQPISASRRWE